MSGIKVESVGFEFETSTIHPFKQIKGDADNLEEKDELKIMVDGNTLTIYQDSPLNIKTLFDDTLLRKPISRFLPLSDPHDPHAYPIRTTPYPHLLQNDYPKEDVNYLNDLKFNLEIEYLINEDISNKDLNLVISEELPKLYDYLSSSLKLSGYYQTQCPPLVEYTLDGGNDSFKLLFIMSKISDEGIKKIDKSFLYSNFTPQMTIGIKITNIEQTFLKFETLCDSKKIDFINLKSISLLLDGLDKFDDDLGGGGGLKHLQVTKHNVIKHLLRNVCFYIIYLYHILTTRFKFTFDEGFNIEKYNDEYIKVNLFFNPRNSVIEIINYINYTYKTNLEILINDLLIVNISIEFDKFLELILTNQIKSVDESSALSSNVENPPELMDELLTDNFIIRNDIVFFEIRFFFKLFENKTFESILNKKDVLLTPIKASKKYYKRKKSTKKKKNKKQSKKKKNKKKRKLSTRATKSTRTSLRSRYYA